MDNSDTAAGVAVRASVATCSSSSPPSFLNLPDEVLRLVFEFDYAGEKPMYPFHYVLNKRISAVCLSLLHRHLSISKKTKDAVLDSIYEDEKRRSSLKSLKLYFDKEVPRITCRILKGLPRLTRLSITLVDGDSFPTYLTDALRSFITLRHLQLSARSFTPIEDTTFRFSELPALQSLDLVNGCAMNALVDGTDRPIDLTLDYSYNVREDQEKTYPALPWSSIRSLSLPVSDTLMALSLSRTSQFWKSFAEAIGKLDSSNASSYQHVPLKAISLTGFRGCAAEDHRNWLVFLDLLSETQLESLSLNDLLPKSLDDAQRPLKTVKTLSLTTDLRLIKHGSNWPNLLAFLELFPHLEHLHFGGSWFDRYFQADNEGDLQADGLLWDDYNQLPSTVDDLARSRLIDSRARYPYLYSLFDYLRETSVREVRLSSVIGNREMRWRRSRSGEAFQADCWNKE